jgi:ESS family glutamate:Na+ symporter
MVGYAFLAACGLLLIGFVLRSRLRILRILYMPASVVAGLVGFVLLQVAPRPTALEAAADALVAQFRTWPGILIAVVFAGLLLERPARPFHESARLAARAGLYAWIIIVGQIILGLLATWLIIRRFFDVPMSFGQLIEAGFAGGHGSAVALGNIYGKLGFPAGMDLALFVATFGLVYGVLSGIVFVNIGVRRGWTRRGTADIAADANAPAAAANAPAAAANAPAADANAPAADANAPTAADKPMAWARTPPDLLDPLAFQLLLLMLAVVVGMALQQAVWVLGPPADRLFGTKEQSISRNIQNLPLFMFTLLAGLMVRHAMALLRLDHLIDTASVKRLTGVAMEFLIVAAMASLRLEAVAAFFWPVALLLAIGCAWTAVCLLVIAPRVLPRAYWFELGILNYGMSTATTAQGMLLLRMIDKDLESGAAEDYALAAPMSAPFIGGGIITVSLPFILADFHVIWALVPLALAWAVCLWLALRLARGGDARGFPIEPSGPS